MDSVEILMSVSACAWHGNPMTTRGGTTGRRLGTRGAGWPVVPAVQLLSSVPIVIGVSPGFPLFGGVQHVVYGGVMPVLQVTTRATWLAATPRARWMVPATFAVAAPGGLEHTA